MLAKDAANSEEKVQQRLINAYHRVFEDPEWELVRNDLEERFTMNNPSAAFLGNGQCDPYRVLFKEGARALLCHIDGMLSREPKGDANADTANIKIIK